MNRPRVMFARTGGIGNALAAVPALRALKRAWPEAGVTLVVERPSAEALAGCPYVDEFIIYEKRGADAGARGWLRILGRLRKRKFTHAILSKRFLRMSLLARLSGAKVRVGFWGYGHAINKPVKWEPFRHVIRTNLDLLAALGIEPCGYEMEIWPSESDRKDAESFLGARGLLDHPCLVAIHPGGVSHRGYLWPVENYVGLARRLEKTYSAQPIFIGGPADKEELDRIKELSGGKYPICDGLNIRAAAHLISKCRFFVGSDSAPSHLACAVGTPEVIYYDPRPDREECIARWAPLTGIHVIAGPLPGGRHPDVDKMMEFVGELISVINRPESRLK